MPAVLVAAPVRNPARGDGTRGRGGLAAYLPALSHATSRHVVLCAVVCGWLQPHALWHVLGLRL